jgi:hypothetical protein
MDNRTADRKATMNSTLEALSAANESTLEYVTSIQERILSAYRDFSATAKADVPSAVAPWIPTPERETTRDVVEETFAFATKLLEANKSFALGLLDVSEPAAAKSSKK